jgi:hypothetical protein
MPSDMTGRLPKQYTDQAGSRLAALAVLKSTAKTAVNLVSPALLSKVLAWRARLRCEQMYSPLADKVRAKLYGAKPVEVLNGPFKGLKFVGQSNLGPIIPKWVGTYESQLQPVIASIVNSDNYETIIDLGAAEGYYSVGLAWRLPRARLFSYDIDPLARRIQRDLAHANGVTNLSINGRCSHEELTRRIHGRTLVISDIEGSEYELLNPRSCTALTRADILLELHPLWTPYSWYRAEADCKQLTELAEAGRREMISRFERSHRIHSIPQAAPDRRKCEILKGALSRDEVRMALSEDRPYPMTWLWMEAK